MRKHHRIPCKSLSKQLNRQLVTQNTAEYYFTCAIVMDCHSGIDQWRIKIANESLYRTITRHHNLDPCIFQGLESLYFSRTQILVFFKDSNPCIFQGLKSLYFSRTRILVFFKDSYPCNFQGLESL